MRSFRWVDPDDWAVHAACRGTTNYFFPPDDGTETRAERKEREASAKAICGTCGVREECLDEALKSGERFGVWGGLTERERRSAKVRETFDRTPLDISAGPGRPSRLPAVVVQGRPMSLWEDG